MTAPLAAEVASPAAARPLRVAHVITALHAGGAEGMLHRLVLASRPLAIEPHVISLGRRGYHADRLEAAGVAVEALGMGAGVAGLAAPLRLVAALRRARPDVVQTWMYHGDLLGGAAARALGVPVLWGIRHAELDPRSSRLRTRLVAAACARVSGLVPARIVCCAAAALRAHAALGYRADLMTVIPNGFDFQQLAPDPAARARVRRELGIAPGAPVVGLLARFHPDKDPRTFVEAAARVAAARPDVVFVLAGPGLEPGNADLSGWIAALGLSPRVHLLGHRRDAPAVLAAMDVLALSSRTEAFPNVLVEAMACGVAPVATDCGDAREILDGLGRIVPPGDPSALAAAALDLLGLPGPERAALGAAARASVLRRYRIDEIAARYAALYRAVAAGARSG